MTVAARSAEPLPLPCHKQPREVCRIKLRGACCLLPKPYTDTWRTAPSAFTNPSSPKVDHQGGLRVAGLHAASPRGMRSTTRKEGRRERCRDLHLSMGWRRRQPRHDGLRLQPSRARPLFGLLSRRPKTIPNTDAIMLGSPLKSPGPARVYPLDSPPLGSLGVAIRGRLSDAPRPPCYPLT